ncbi:hypothetical protein Tco_0268567 [Tanacetum coccineum]
MHTIADTTRKIINPQEIQQVTARDEKWVPSTEWVKISPTNVRLETTVPQKEETFQVVIDVIKNSTCFKAFTISADVLEIFMQQFWYTIKKILDICPRVEGEEFPEVQDDDATLTFLINLGYKGPLHKYTNMYVDHMHQPWRTLTAIINKCISGKTIDHGKERHQYVKLCHYPDSPKLKFVRIGEDYKEYGLPIPDMMLNEKIKQSESYQMFFKYSTGQIPPKKSRGKGSQGKKTTDTPVADVDVSEEFNSEPARKKTASRRVIKKKVTISAADNIIPDLDVALELGKSISLTEAAEEEATRQVHTTHARIVTESIPEPARRRPSEQEAANTMKALKESKKTNRRQPCAEGSSEGTGRIPGVPDESTVVSTTSSEGTDDEKEDDEKKDKEMTDVEVEESRNGDEEITNAAKADAEKTEVVKDDAKKAELPPTSSSLSVFSGFCDQFIKLSSDTSLIGTVKDTTDAEINSLLDIKIQFEVPHIQSSSVLRVPVYVISKPSVLTPVQETPLVAYVTTLPPPFVSTIPLVPHQTTAPIPTPLITTDAPTITTAVPESDTLSDVQLRVVKLEKGYNYLGSKFGDVLQKELQEHITDLIQKHSVKPTPELTKIQTPLVDLKQESENSPLVIRKIKRKQAEKLKMSKYTIKSTNKAIL